MGASHRAKRGEGSGATLTRAQVALHRVSAASAGRDSEARVKRGRAPSNPPTLPLSFSRGTHTRPDSRRLSQRRAAQRAKHPEPVSHGSKATTTRMHVSYQLRGRALHARGPMSHSLVVIPPCVARALLRVPESSFRDERSTPSNGGFTGGWPGRRAYLPQGNSMTAARDVDVDPDGSCLFWA